MTSSFFISILFLIPGLLLIEGGTPKGSVRRKHRRKITEVFVVETSPGSEQEVSVNEVLGVDKNKEKLDKNFERRRHRREKKKVDKENCEKDGNCGKQSPPHNDLANVPTWSPTISPVPTITAFPTREPILVFSVDPVTDTPSSGGQTFTAVPVPTVTPQETLSVDPVTDTSSSGGQTFTAVPVPTVTPQETLSVPTATLTFTAAPAPTPTEVIGSPAERPIPESSPLDSGRFEFPSNLASAEPSESVTEVPSVTVSEEPSVVVSQAPSISITSESLSEDIIVEEDELELNIACEALKSGLSHTTDHYIDVMYMYEVLKSTTSTLETVLEFINEKVQSSMAERFIPCETRARRLQPLGVILEDGRNNIGSCSFLKVTDTQEEDECLLMQGSVKLYLSRDSQMTRDSASKMVFEFFLDSFNDGSDPSRSLLSSSNFIDAEKGILGIHFSGLVGEDGNLITDKSIFSAATRTRGGTSGGNSEGINVFGIGMIAAACGCVLAVGVIVGAHVRGRKRRYGIEISESKDDDSSASESGKIQVVETDDTTESAVSGLASFYEVNRDDKGDKGREGALFMNRDGGVVSSPPDFGVERPYVISDTVDL